MNSGNNDSEVTLLRNEIENLRAQIDGLVERTRELELRNKELQEQIHSLSQNKLDLEKLQTQKDELFAQIIHDIKNPAAIIHNLVELLRSYDNQAIDQQEIIQDIELTSQRILKLSQEFSRIVALEANRIPIEVMEAPLNEVVRDIVRLNQFNAERKSIKLLSELSEDIPDAEFDPQKISEVIENLVSNAIKFTNPGGIVKVRTYQKDSFVCCEVIDTGIGLTEEDIKKAFTKGAKLSAKPTAGESSTGLGLWIVKKLIDVHKGKVWVKSVLGKGSTFGFYLPIKHSSTMN